MSGRVAVVIKPYFPFLHLFILSTTSIMPPKRPAPSSSSGPSRRTRRSTSEESDGPDVATEQASQGASSNRGGLSVTASYGDHV
jgi:hypothetical protein